MHSGGQELGLLAKRRPVSSPAKQGYGVVGGGCGKLKGGQHLKYEDKTPLANLHLTLLDKVGVRLDKFGDSNGKVDELFEPLGM